VKIKFKPIDYLHFIYLSIVSIAILIFHNKVEGYSYYIIGYLSYIVIIIFLAHLATVYPKNMVIKFFRLLYPIITFAFMYKSVEGYVLILHNHFLDANIIKFEKSVLGINPTLALEKIVSKPLTEFLKFSYFSYYFYTPVPALILFFQKRFKELEQFVFTITFTFYISYIGFVLYPLESPRFALASVYKIKVLSGYIFTHIQDFIMAKGAIKGGCMPSSHLAVAWVSLFLIKKYFGKPFWFILPFTLAMTFAIVYNRYHYVSDAIMGLIVGFLSYQFVKRLKI